MDEKVIARFWAKVDVRGPDECWEWTAHRLPPGYGTIRIALADRRAHRVSYEIAFGPPGELFVCHKCDNPPCVNPRHLFLGTAADNNWDKSRKGRVVNNPRRGSATRSAKLTEQQVIEARRLCANGQSYKSVGKLLGVSASCIHLLYRRRNWSHL